MSLERCGRWELSELGSASASVTTYLELTRPIVAEAYGAPRDEQDAERILVEALSATRNKTYQGIRVYHTESPRLYCCSKDPFLQKLHRCSLLDSVHRGADPVPFPVRMARATRS